MNNLMHITGGGFISKPNSKPEYHQFSSYFACKTGSQTIKNSTKNAPNLTILSSKIKHFSGEDDTVLPRKFPIGKEDIPFPNLTSKHNHPPPRCFDPSCIKLQYFLLSLLHSTVVSQHNELCYTVVVF